MNVCKIIEDILPLYVDGLLQEETAELVKKHLATCPACAKMEKQLKAAIPAPPQKPEGQNRLRRVKRKVQLRALFISAGSLLLAAGIFIAAYLPYYFHKREAEEAILLHELAVNEIQSNLYRSNVVVDPSFEVIRSEGEGNRVSYDGISFCLPTENFRETEAGSYGNYEIYEGDEQLTDTIVVTRFTAKDDLSDYKNIDFANNSMTPVTSMPPSQNIRNIYDRGYELMRLRGSENSYLNLALAAGRFDFGVIEDDPTDDELALALFFSYNYKRLLGNGTAMMRWFQMEVSPTTYCELCGSVSGFLTRFTVRTKMNDGAEYANSYWRAVLQGADERYYYTVDIIDNDSNVAANGWQSSLDQIQLLLQSVRFE